MILRDKNQRLVLWGCEWGAGQISAELAFFGPSLSYKTTLYHTKSGQQVTVYIPKEAQKLNMPTKTQNVMLQIKPEDD